MKHRSNCGPVHIVQMSHNLALHATHATCALYHSTHTLAHSTHILYVATTSTSSNETFTLNPNQSKYFRFASLDPKRECTGCTASKAIHSHARTDFGVIWFLCNGCSGCCWRHCCWPHGRLFLPHHRHFPHFLQQQQDEQKYGLNVET